jgi:hypothetical protein
MFRKAAEVAFFSGTNLLQYTSPAMTQLPSSYQLLNVLTRTSRLKQMLASNTAQL